VAILTAWFAWREYKRMIKHKQCEVFAKYNERYENSEYIQKVVKYCTVKTINREDIPTIHDKEMFLRFFEELEMMVQEEYLTEEKVGNYFAYYFLVVWNDKSFFWDSEMCKPYNTMKEAQDGLEWQVAHQLFDRIKKKWYTKEIQGYAFPNVAVDDSQSKAGGTSE